MKATVIAVLALVFFSSAGSASDRYFTVRDSIEMKRFDRENANVAFSPDNRYFAVVTSRGVIATDTIESVLWIFSSDRVRAFLAGTTKAFQPRMVAKINTGVSGEFSTSYEPVISALQWLPHSKGILFLGGGVGRRRLYRIDFASGKTRALTTAGYDVTQFVQASNGVIYQATPHTTYAIGERINADAIDVTARSLDDILFPTVRHGVVDPTYNALFITRQGRTKEITGRDLTHPLRLLDRYDVLASSPDGRAVVVLAPVETMPSSWVNFEPQPDFPYLRLKHDSTTTASSNFFRPVEYVLIDVASGRETRLIQAPNAEVLNSGHTSKAVWAPDGVHVMVTNTFLPLEGVRVQEQTKRHYPCLAAVVNVHSLAESCVTFGSYGYTTQKGGGLLEDASFGKNANEVTLRMQHLPDRVYRDDFYRNEEGRWKLVSSSATIPSPTSKSRELSVVVKQDLNTSPALWASDRQNNLPKKLWDPNPQLRAVQLGEASVLRWKDASGYEWVAGLVKPPNYVLGKRYPLVIQTHGFAQDEFVTDGIFTTAFAARPLASAGIVVLQMPMNWKHVGTSKEASDQLLEFESAIAELDAAGIIDPKEVGIIGFSRTSYYAESALILNPHLFAAASITDSTDESYMEYLLLGPSFPHFRDDPEHIYGTSPFQNGLSVWVEHAPGFNLDRVQTPLLVTALGPLTLLTEWETYASLEMQKKPVDLMYLPQPNGYQHVLQRPLERLASQQGNVDWFRFWLQGYEDPDPAKKTQYRHWEALRHLQEQNQLQTR